MNVHPVSSKEHMLIPEDIFLVAAHTEDFNAPRLARAAKAAGMSKERIKYTLFIQAYSDPRLIRFRAGNTLFTIAGLPKRTGFVRMYNADTAQNLIDNLVEFFDTARAMGFDYLVAQPNKLATKAIKLAERQNTRNDIDTHFDTAANVLIVTTGKPRE